MVCDLDMDWDLDLPSDGVAVEEGLSVVNELEGDSVGNSEDDGRGGGVVSLKFLLSTDTTAKLLMRSSSLSRSVFELRSFLSLLSSESIVAMKKGKKRGEKKRAKCVHMLQ